MSFYIPTGFDDFESLWDLSGLNMEVRNESDKVVLRSIFRIRKIDFVLTGHGAPERIVIFE